MARKHRIVIMPKNDKSNIVAYDNRGNFLIRQSTIKPKQSATADDNKILDKNKE